MSVKIYFVQGKRVGDDWTFQRAEGYGGDDREFGTDYAARVAADKLLQESSYDRVRVLEAHTVYFQSADGQKKRQ